MKFFTLVLFFFVASSGLWAQSSTSARVAYENFVRQYLHRSDKTSVDGQKYIIPVVVHVVYSEPENRVSEAQVRSEFEHLRKLYRRIPGTYGFGAGADTRIEFELATVAPDGSPTEGITYTQNAEYADLQVGPDPNADYPASENVALKTLVGWDRNKYLNIWVVEKITVLSDAAELAGYAQFPWEEATTTDGVVIAADRFGSSAAPGSKALYRYDYTTAKNLGHWLGLLDVYTSGGCTPDDCSQTGDLVCDTPPSYSRPKRTDERINSCNLEAGGDRPDLARNIMENCFQPMAPNQFTAGQAVRCHATLENPDLPRRHSLWQEANHQATGVGKWGKMEAEFSASHRFTCLNARIKFQNYSRNFPTRYLWLFPGGTPASSDEPNPVVSYAAEGNYDVVLYAIRQTNGHEEESMVVKKNYIRVTDRRTSIPANIQNAPEGFQITVPPVTWGLENPDSVRTDSVGLTWRMHTQAPGMVNGAGAFGKSTAAAVFPGYFYGDYGQRDAMVTVTYNGTQRVGIGVEFSYAYAPLYFERDNPNLLAIRRLYADTLNVWYSTDCGETWELAWSKGGLELNTAGTVPDQDTPGPFVPTRDQWRKETVRLLNADRKPFIRIKFEAVNGWGNHIYLDDVNVQVFFHCDTCCNAACCVDTCDTTSHRLLASASEFVVYPNPAKSEITVDFGLTTAGAVEIELSNLFGVRVASWDTEVFPAGRSKKTLSLPPLPAGVYLLTLRSQKSPALSAKITVLPE